VNSISSRSVQEDHLTIVQEDSTRQVNETNEANSTRMIIQAQLVVDNDAERVAQEEEANPIILGGHAVVAHLKITLLSF
jgi:hypothetical protein